MPAERQNLDNEGALTETTQVEASPRSSKGRNTTRTKARGGSTVAVQIFEYALDLARTSSEAEADDRDVRLAVLSGLHARVKVILPLLEALELAARLAAGEALPPPTWIDIGALANRVVKALEPTARDRGLHLEAHGGDAGGVHVPREALDHVLRACVGLALLASRDGGTVTVETSRAGDRIQVEIGARRSQSKDEAGADSGVNQMSPDIVAGVIEELAPLALPLGAELDGSAQAAGGFDLRLKLPAAVSPSGLSRTGKILIVDDDPDGAFLLEQVLAKASYEVEIAHNGLEGLTMAKRPEIALVLLDVMLPGMDGYEVCHRLREEKATAHLPIVMISAKARAEDRAMGLRMGANVYLMKPLRMNEVLEQVGLMLAKLEEGSHDR